LGQKKGKSSGLNGLAMEAFMYGNTRLHVHLSLFFTFCIKHCYLPSCFMACVIVPLIKNKGIDLTDIHNYRAIALSNVETKLLESVILQRVVMYTESDKYQFLFQVWPFNIVMCKCYETNH